MPPDDVVPVPEGMRSFSGRAAADAKSGLVLAPQDWQKLGQDQRNALQEARDAVLALSNGLPPQRFALTSQLQVCPIQSSHHTG